MRSRIKRRKPKRRRNLQSESAGRKLWDRRLRTPKSERFWVGTTARRRPVEASIFHSRNSKGRSAESWIDPDQSQKGETVFLDFTAKWCITCQVNKIRILEDKQVINLFSDKNITLIRADWTRQNKEIEDEIRKYGRIGVPLNILLRPGKPPYVFSEWLNKDELISLIGD